MANNVYIGARYVPVFDGAWNNAKIYEPLTIVTYNNSSYTSKTQVPAGIAPTNTDYWALTGNYNGQISNLQNQIDDINANISDIQSDITIGRNYIDNKKILFVSDSYGTITDNWVSQIVSLLGLSSDHYVNISVSGSGLLDTNVETWLNMVTNYNGIIDREDFTDIIICGGINDMRTEDDPTIAKIRTGLYNLIHYCRGHYPKAKIYVGFIGWVRALNDTGGVIRYNISNYGLPAYHEVATWGATYLTGVEAAVHDARLFDVGENTHPNSNGSRQIALAIMQAWIGGSYHKTTVPVTSDGSLFNTTDYNPNQTNYMYSFADGYNVHLVGKTVNVGLVNPLAVTANQQYTLTNLFTHVSSLIIGSQSTGTVVQDTFDLPFDVVYSDGTLALISGACTLHSDGTANVIFYAPKDGTINSLRLKAFQRTISMFQK